ncbi:hypothetical protein [Sphingomonas azotifigens]|uniref:hypothetical protein n=1 Tax=Sphingomonas azotifigens TaxID=330920 RepID=UPI001C3F7CFA|nr:hypothetical protein [Sphingomonas azotifigens]
MMQKPKPYRSPRRQPSHAAVLPRRLRRTTAASAPIDTDLDIVFEWEADAPTQH